MKTLYITHTIKDRYKIDERYPAAGPNPSITGMKKLFWGQDACCVKCGMYVYKVTKKMYNKIKGDLL